MVRELTPEMHEAIEKYRGKGYFAPSAAKTWLVCGASLIMSQQLDEVEESRTAADMGTVTHKVFELYVRDGIKPQEWVGKYPCGESMPKFPQAECDTLADPCQWVDDLRAQGFQIISEKRIRIPVVPGGLCRGTADIIAWHEERQMVAVGDLKTGMIFVDIGNLRDLNHQLALYMIGVVHMLRSIITPERARFAILQPKAGGNQEFDCSIRAIECFQRYAEDRGYEALRILAGGKKKLKRSDFNPFPSACQDCKGRDNCRYKV